MLHASNKKQKIISMDGVRKVRGKQMVRITTASTQTPQARPLQRRVARVPLGDMAQKKKPHAKRALQFITPLFVPEAPHRLLQKAQLLRKAFRIYKKRFVRAARVRLEQPGRLPKLATAFAIVAMIASFGGGAYLEWSSKQSSANSEDQVLAATTEASIEQAETIPTEEALQTFIQLLANERVEVTSEEPDAYTLRKHKLQNYLASKRSPLAKDDLALDALLHSKNMKMMLGISFVESNFAQHCVDNNCSGIGVAPDHPSWQKFKSLANWIIAFDQLLERRYKNWTPEEMLGVYVYPGSENWKNGVEQVLAELRRAGIE